MARTPYSLRVRQHLESRAKQPGYSGNSTRAKLFLLTLAGGEWLVCPWSYSEGFSWVQTIQFTWEEEHTQRI